MSSTFGNGEARCPACSPGLQQTNVIIRPCFPPTLLWNAQARALNIVTFVAKSLLGAFFVAAACLLAALCLRRLRRRTALAQQLTWGDDPECGGDAIGLVCVLATHLQFSYVLLYLSPIYLLAHMHLCTAASLRCKLRPVCSDMHSDSQIQNEHLTGQST